MGARVGIHTSAAYEPGLIETLRGVLVARIPAEFTSCFVNEYHQGKRRQTIESVAEKLTYEQLLPEWRNPPIVHFGPLCQELDAAALINRFPRSLIGVTPQGWMRAWDDDGLVHAVPWADAERVLAKADSVVISEDDVADRSVIEEWARQARMLVVTLGDRGCDVFRGGEEPYHSPAFKSATEVDPTGAGDVFAAAFLWHLYKSGGDWRTAADWANCVASFVVEKRGVAGVPKLADVEKRWQSGARIGLRAAS
jgi:pfkB family carbohydrate kinase